MIKLSYMRKTSSGKYDVFSDTGEKIGTYPTRIKAAACLEELEMSKLAAKDSKKDVFDGVDTTSYSAVLRALRKTDSGMLRAFQSIFKNVFDALVLRGDEEPADRALEMALRMYSSYDKKSSKMSMPRFANVEFGIYRGGAPSTEDLQKMRKLYGITRVISLDMKAGEAIAEECKKLGIEHVMMPVQAKNFSVVKKFPLLDWKKLLTDAGPTYIHCLHGKDRTGLAVAIYRCQTGWSSERAIQEADEFGFCTGLPKAVRRIYSKLIQEASESKDDNSAMAMPWPSQDFVTINHNPSVIVDMWTGNNPSNATSWDISEYMGGGQSNHTDASIPTIGLQDRQPNGFGPLEGPPSIGTGII